MQYNPKIHHRRSIRLKGYDYSQKGLYFITICSQNRECLFGKITVQPNVGTDPCVCPQPANHHNTHPKMVLNDAGKMVEKWYYELMNKFPDIKCDTMVVMPNHFHCIIKNVGANRCVCPHNNDELDGTVPVLGEHVGYGDEHGDGLGEHGDGLGEHVGSPLRAVVQWFKTMTTNEYIRGVKNLGWQPFPGKLWQRNYYEHIIRNEHAYQNISNYIINNPAKWHGDIFFGDAE